MTLCIKVCKFVKFKTLDVTSFHTHFVTQSTKNTAYSAVTSISLVL